jgi:hypothetical protein
LLAVLCQVHLLNNVGERQRPDLVFFNSFLIVFVTSFFAPDLTWSLLFVAHTFVLVPSLELHALTGRDREVDGRALRAIMRDSVPRTLTVGTLTALVFVLWPRDFDRAGWIGTAIEFGQQLDAGLSDRISIDRNGPVRMGDEIVAHFEPVDGGIERIPTHWRGIAFAEFDGRTWFPQDAGRLGSRFATDMSWQQERDGTWRREPRGPSEVVVRVLLADNAAQHLLAPLRAHSLLIEPDDQLLLDPKSFGGFAMLRITGKSRSPLRYTIGVSPHATTVAPEAYVRGQFTALPDVVPRLVYDLARQLRSSLPNDADALVIATTTSDWLQANRRYQLPGEAGFAKNLGEFLLGTGAGHCEYFATALALLLRVQDVPCRLVGGYLAHEQNPSAGMVVARARDAHAWVEAMDERGAWHTFDATPAADVMRAPPTASGWWQRTVAEIEALWAVVVGFDADNRRLWLDTLLVAPGNHPIATGAVLVAMALLIWARRRRRQRLPAIADLERAVRAARLSRLPGETPRELLQRARAALVPEQALAALGAATDAHERRRYRSIDA